MTKKIDESICIGCGKCEQTCIVGCIREMPDGKRSIETAACVDCGACQLICPIAAIC